jgi:hypothetical protein
MMAELFAKFQPIRGTNTSMILLLVPVDWAVLFGLSYMVAKAARMGWGE